MFKVGQPEERSTVLAFRSFTLGYPFKPIVETPSISSFWKKPNNTTQGIIIITPTAICALARLLLSVAVFSTKSKYNANESVQLDCSSITYINGPWKSFQQPKKPVTAR